jgi:hypothetical protein
MKSMNLVVKSTRQTIFGHLEIVSSLKNQPELGDIPKNRPNRRAVSAVIDLFQLITLGPSLVSPRIAGQQPAAVDKRFPSEDDSVELHHFQSSQKESPWNSSSSAATPPA